jgi:acyl-homoserine lactone acylase PvdQ
MTRIWALPRPRSGIWRGWNCLGRGDRRHDPRALPVVLAGPVEGLGWGADLGYLDDQDVFIERLNPDNPEEYLTPTGWKPFETRRSIITVKDADPLTLTLRWTENGPVLPGSHYDLASRHPARPCRGPVAGPR